MNPQNQSDGWSAGKIFAVIAAVIAGFVVISCIGCLGYFASIPSDGGVKLNHEMQSYAIEYLEEHQILRPDEKIIGYYDKTLYLEGTNAYIITDQRLIHHNERGNFDVSLESVENVEEIEGAIGSSIFVVTTRDGDVFRMEIDPLNGADKFADAIDSALRQAGSEVKVRRLPSTSAQPQSQGY